MDRRNRKYNWIWFLLIGFFVIGDVSSAWLPLLIILAIVIGIAVSAVSQSRKEDQTSYSHNSRRSPRQTYRSNRFSSADLARINVYLRHVFANETQLLINGLQLRLHDDAFHSLSSLDVYQDGSYLCSMNDFGRRYPDSYEDILQELKNRADQPQDENVFDAEAEVHEEKDDQSEAAEKNTAQDFIEEIDQLNQDIPDEEISNGLYETTALLRQIQKLELKLPNSRDKLQKLYSYYLPILTKILHQYVNVQNAAGDENYERTRKKLADTIKLINEAMRNIISSMADADLMNLSADMSTLEALLRKDGLTDEGQMKNGDTEQK